MVLRANSRKHDKFIASEYHNSAVLCLVTQLCPTLCDHMDCSLPVSSVHEDSPGKNTGMGCHALLTGALPNLGIEPGLPHCRWILYHKSHQGSPRILEWVALSLLQEILLTQRLNQDLLHCMQILYQLSYQRKGKWKWSHSVVSDSLWPHGL